MSTAVWILTESKICSLFDHKDSILTLEDRTTGYTIRLNPTAQPLEDVAPLTAIVYAKEVMIGMITAAGGHTFPTEPTEIIQWLESIEPPVGNLPI